jgi:chromosome segregation ATPase
LNGIVHSPLFSELASLDDQKKRLDEELKRINTKYEWLQGWARNMQEVKSSKSPDTFLVFTEDYASQIQSFLGFYEQQLHSVDQSKIQIDAQIGKINTRRAEINKELEKFNLVTDSPTFEITITLSAPSGGAVK